MTKPFTPPIITLPQDTETPAHRDLAPGIGGTYSAFTYVYARSRDTREGHSTGQDFIAYRYDEQRIAFAVCDGVSQSFFGDLAARFLGVRLVEWLWAADTSDQGAYLAELNALLQSWSHDATALVEAKTFRADLPEMQKIALERKRANGSESMFVAGQIDRQADRLALCWLGDMRLHLWAPDASSVEIPGAVWETRERWSTRVGPKNGDPRGCVLPLVGIRRITAHSDGVGHFADSFGRLAQDQLGPMVDELQNAATSDDVSVLDIDLNVSAPYGDYLPLSTPQWAAPQQSVEPVLRWQAVPFAARYRVWIDDGQAPYTRDIDGESTTFFPVLPPKPADPVAVVTLTCAVQAINDYALPSSWSTPLTFQLDAQGGTTIALPPTPISEAVIETASESKQTNPPKKKKRRRGQAFVILLTSALILAVLMTVFWIGSTVIDWPTLVNALLHTN